jgi:hypothetical protein
VRGRGLGSGIGGAVLAAVLAAFVNLVVVTIVGMVQQGWAPLFMLFAVLAGIAFVIGAAIAVPVAFRVVKPEAPQPRQP